MSVNSLLEKIKLAQNQHNDELVQILERFYPLIYRLCGLLQYEDAKNDLEYYLISLILKLKVDKFQAIGDPAVISYIKKSMYRYYILLSKQKILSQNVYLMSDLSEEDIYWIEHKASTDNFEDHTLISDLKKFLNPHEFDIIYLHYFLEYTIPEIAIIFSCFRQSINQTKNRALKKLRNIL